MFRIVIDMQGAQTESRFRGIGRYTLSFTQAVVRNKGEHEIILALSGLFPGTIEPIRAAFNGLLPQENIRVWHAPGPVKECELGNDNRREVAELIREAFLASLQPDVIHITSLFEGYVDNAITSIGCFDTRTPVTAMLYDLIPLLNPDQYLTPNPDYAFYYQRKLGYLWQAKKLLSISKFARQEGLNNLNMDEDKLVNISASIDSCFVQNSIDAESEATIRQQLGLSRRFILYTGGSDERKNLPRLIQAYAKLPAQLRHTHQLVLAGAMDEKHIAKFKQIAQSAGLSKDELNFTGYVRDEQLVKLYKLCNLYVFPSWHEGFGLPALEAMACGAAVIGANTSSLPEVIGSHDAMFDPLDVDAISAKMYQALNDNEFYKKLLNNGDLQVVKFSWDKTAKIALEVWGGLADNLSNGKKNKKLQINELIKVMSSHLEESDDQDIINLSHCLAQNASSGIERQLLVDVSELCQRDSATGVQRVVRSYLLHLLKNPPSDFRVLPVYATHTDGYRYANKYASELLNESELKINDEFIRWQRGDVFFGLDMQHHIQLSQANFYARLRQDGVVVKFLVYDLLPIQLEKYFQDSAIKMLHEQLLAMIALQDQAICISQATEIAYKAWLKSKQIPVNHALTTTWVHMGADLEGSKPSIGLPFDAREVLKKIQSRTTFLAVSTLEPRKAQTQILDAVERLWADDRDVNLVLVGQEGWKVEALLERIGKHPENGKRLFWLKGISDAYLDLVYETSSCLVAASLNEGFGLPLIEAASHGLPILARDIPVFREVSGDAAYYFTGDTAEALKEALQKWLMLYTLGQHPKPDGVRWSTWQESTENLIHALLKENYSRKQLLVDVSQLVQCDAKTGIQRVVRSILKEWIKQPPQGYRVELVYATYEQGNESTYEKGYKYARRFTALFMDESVRYAEDDLIDYAPGDVFLGLDFDPFNPQFNKHYLRRLKESGVSIYFVLYDLLPIRFPHFWPLASKADLVQIDWLSVITSFSGVVCISESVAEELKSWLGIHNPKALNSIEIAHFHLGADIENSSPTQGLPNSGADVLERLKGGCNFLMVGTLEPRKGHAQVLSAFEELWQGGINVSLVIVGKRGWLISELIDRITRHSELNNRLFWLEGISDEYLEKVYGASTCLIAASYGEGFGLPLIEAAQHKISIIARDIPVFREVAGDHAFYFKADHPEELAEAIATWHRMYKDDQHPKSDNLPWLTWKLSAEKLLNLIL